MSLRLAVAALAPLLASSPLAGQDAMPVAVPDVEPLPADVATIDGIVSAFYEVISGPAGEPRDWGRDATLYLAPIFFTVVTAGEDGTPTAHTIPKQEFVDRSDRWLVAHGFVEREIHRETRRFGSIAHVWSTYEWRTDEGETGRGINGIHLFHDGNRWWITHATWDGEREDLPIPAEYLP